MVDCTTSSMETLDELRRRSVSDLSLLFFTSWLKEMLVIYSDSLGNTGYLRRLHQVQMYRGNCEVLPPSFKALFTTLPCRKPHIQQSQLLPALCSPYKGPFSIQKSCKQMNGKKTSHQHEFQSVTCASRISVVQTRTHL